MRPGARYAPLVKHFRALDEGFVHILYTKTLSEKAEELKRRGYAALHCDWRRPALGTVGLTIEGEGFDEQFVDQLLAGTPMDEVRCKRNEWLAMTVKERGK